MTQAIASGASPTLENNNKNWSLAMDREKDNYSTSAEHSSIPESAHPTTKSAMDWEQPDFEEFDLGMEVTTYINSWQ